MKCLLQTRKVVYFANTSSVHHSRQFVLDSLYNWYQSVCIIVIFYNTCNNDNLDMEDIDVEINILFWCYNLSSPTGRDATLRNEMI